MTCWFPPPVGVARNGRRGVAYRSIGEESDAFLLVLSELYRQKAPSLKFIPEVYAEAVPLEGSFSTLQTKPMKIKVFFNANGPESKYAEIYTNIIPAKRVL